MIPEVDSAEEAGRLLENLPALWGAATLDERHDLVTSMLDAVYFDLSDTKSVLAIKPKPPFAAVFSVAAARAGSGIELLPKEKPPAESPGANLDLCFWWRRGRVELPVQEGFRSDIYRLSRRMFLAACVLLRPDTACGQPMIFCPANRCRPDSTLTVRRSGRTRQS